MTLECELDWTGFRSPLWIHLVLTVLNKSSRVAKASQHTTNLPNLLCFVGKVIMWPNCCASRHASRARVSLWFTTEATHTHTKKTTLEANRTMLGRYMRKRTRPLYSSLTHGAEPFLKSRQLCSFSRNYRHFLESEGSSCSQEPSTGPYPEPDQCDPYHLIISL
jgi:hypothetical protein